MNCGFSWRPPRRPAAVGRLVLLACLVVLMLGSSAGPASAYPCKPPDPAPAASDAGARTLAAHAESQPKDCDTEPAQAPRRRTADPMSFVFFIGILVAVVFVPVALGRREELPPE